MSRILKWLPSIGGSSNNPPSATPSRTALPCSDDQAHPCVIEARKVLACYRLAFQGGSEGATVEVEEGVTATTTTSTATSGNFLMGCFNGGLVEAQRPTSGLWQSSALVQQLFGLVDAVLLHEVHRVMSTKPKGHASSSRYVGRSASTSGGSKTTVTSAADSMRLYEDAHPRWNCADAFECISDVANCLLDLHVNSGGTATGGDTLDAVKLFCLLFQVPPLVSGTQSAAAAPSYTKSIGSSVDWKSILRSFTLWKRTNRADLLATADSITSDACPPENDDLDADAVAQVACILLDLVDSQACGVLRCLTGAASLLLQQRHTPSSSQSGHDDWVMGEDCAEQLCLRLVDSFHQTFVKSFSLWAVAAAAERSQITCDAPTCIVSFVSILLSDEFGSQSADAAATTVILSGKSVSRSVLTSVALDFLKRHPTPPQQQTLSPRINIAAALVLESTRKLLHAGEAEQALQLIGECLLMTSTRLISSTLSEQLWCCHAACLRECASLEASTALTREAYDGAMIEVRSSCARSSSLLMSTLQYGKMYHEALRAVARRQMAKHGNGNLPALAARWRTVIALLSECRCTWEKALVLLVPQQRWVAVSSEDVALDALREGGHVEMLQHCPSPHAMRPLLLHWGEYRSLMQLRLWLAEATSEALVMLQSGCHQRRTNDDTNSNGGGVVIVDPSEGSYLRSTSRHLFVECNVWLDGLSHPRWGLQRFSAVHWASMEMGIRRGALLFHHGGFDSVAESITEWEKALQMVWLHKANVEKSRSSCTTSAPTPTYDDLQLVRTAFRLLANLCQGLIAVAEREGCVEKNKKLLTDALNYAYQAKSLTAPFAGMGRAADFPNIQSCDDDADAVRRRASSLHAPLHQAHLTASYLVCRTLAILGQHRKASMMAEILMDTFARRRTDTTNSPDDDPIVEALAIETMALYAACLAKVGDPASSRDVCDKAQDAMAAFHTKWFEITTHHHHHGSTSGNKCSSSASTTRTPIVSGRGRMGALTPLALGTLIYETSYRLERGAAIQLCLVRGETFVAQKKWDDALMHFSQGFDLSQRSQQPVVEVAALQFLGRCYRELDQANMAVGYAKQAIDVAKDNQASGGNQVLWYRTSSFLANLLCDLDRRAEASELWGEILVLAQKFGDFEVERSTAKNMITILLRGNQYYEAVTAAESLESTCIAHKEGSSSKDRLFALEKMAVAHIATGEIKKALSVIDRMELLEDTDLAAHDVANHLRSQALLAQREDHAAIDVIAEWKQRAKAQSNNTELLKATFALAEALSNVSLSDAKNEYYAVLELCQEIHQRLAGPDELLSMEQRELGMRASRWLSHAFHLNEDVLEVHGLEDSGCDSVRSEREGSAAGPEAPDDGEECDDVLLLVRDAQGGEEGEEDPILRREGPSYGANDFVFDHDEDPEAAVAPHNSDSATDHCFGLTTTAASQPQQQQRRLFSHDDMTQRIINESKINDNDDHADEEERMVSLVTCFNPQLAIEVAETAMRLLSPSRVLPVARSPKTVVDICLSSIPNATFVFYLLDYTTCASSSTASSSTQSGIGGSGSYASWVAPVFQYDVVVRPAGTPFYYTRTVAVDTPLADYHRRRPPVAPAHVGTAGGARRSQQSAGGGSGGREMRPSGSSHSMAAAESDGTEYLYANLRALYDALWEPVARVSSTSNILHQSDCVVVVPHPSLLHVPFGALVSPKRKAVGQRACVVVSPGLSHLACHTAGNDGNGVLALPRRCGAFESWLVAEEDRDRDSQEPTMGKYLFLNSDTTALVAPSSDKSMVSSSPSSSSSFFSVPRQHGAAGGRDSGGSSPLGELRSCIASMQLTVVHGGTRKELLAAFASESTRFIAVLSDSPPVPLLEAHSSGCASSIVGAQSAASGGIFRMADGDVQLSELTALRQRCSDNLELVVVTNDRRHQPSIFDLGTAARLCTAFNTKRVLRVDVVGAVNNNASSSGITHQHLLMVQLYLFFVHVALSNGLKFPYAVALQAAQAEAIRQYSLPPHVWGGITLVGAP